MIISIIAHPNSRKPRIKKDLLGQIHVYVSEPPLEGRANRAIIESLADYFMIRKLQIILLSGETSKHKRFEITV